jgi:hypothetical protein
MALVGREIRIVNQWGSDTALVYKLARYDVSRLQFTVRSLHSAKEHTLSIDDLARGIADRTLRIERED